LPSRGRLSVSMDRRTDVSVLLPTLDEAETIGWVVEGFREQGYEDILVVDGGSSDGTRRIAEEAGARVIVQSGMGKGQAVREGVRSVEAPVVLMADGDGTYDPAEANPSSPAAPSRSSATGSKTWPTTRCRA